MAVTMTTPDKCSICGRWPATLRPAMRRAVLSIPRHGACEDCHDAFAANLLVAKRGVYATADPATTAPHMAGSRDAPVRGHHAGPIKAGHTRQALPLQPVGVASPWCKRLWPWFTFENITTVLLVSYFVGMVVMCFFPPV
jgi:hypothetical protein